MLKIIPMLLVLSIAIFGKQEAIILNDNYHKYIENDVVFDFYIVNINDLEKLSGEAISSNGKKFNLKFKLDDEYKSSGSESRVIGVFKNTPYPAEELDKYEIEISYDKITTQSYLYVYNTNDEDEVTKLERQFIAFATYGTDFFFQFTPPSGNNIASNQFAFYFKTDGDTKDRGALPGLKANRSDRLTFPSSAYEASLEIVWINPITKKEVAVFPRKSVKIRQTSPTISTSFSSESIAGDDILHCRISNIKLIAPTVGEGKLAKVDFNVEIDQINIRNNYKRNIYKIIGEPSYTIDHDIDSYNATVYFKIIGEPKEDGWAKGTVTLKITAKAINPINDVKSEPVRKTYTYKVNKKIQDLDVDLVRDTLNENDLLIMNKFNKNNSVEIYEIVNTDQIKEILKQINNSEKKDDDINEAKELLNKVSSEEIRVIEEGVYSEKTISQIQQDMILNGYDLPENEVFEKIYEYLFLMSRPKKEEMHTLIYIVTQTSNNNKMPNELIGLIIIELPIEEISSNINDNLYFIYSENIKNANELKNIKVDKNAYKYDNLFELANSYLSNELILLRKVINKK